MKRFALALTLLAAAVASGACSEPAEPEPADPPPTVITDQPVTLGLDVRYVDDDGDFAVLRVPDFPR